MQEEDLSNYQVTSQSVRGLRTLDQAESLRELTERALRRSGDDYLLRVDPRPDGLYDLLVLRRVN
jgi:hypothetical protein